MSTLNRALAKIYGQPNVSPECPKGESTATQCRTNEDVATQVGTASEKPAEPVQSRPDDAPDQPAESSDAAAIDVFDCGDTVAEFDSSPVLELPNTTLRIDGPSSSVVEPPHLALAEVDSTESPQPPLAESSSDTESVVPNETAPADEAESEPGVETGAPHATSAEAAEQPLPDTLEIPANRKPATAISPEWEVDRFRWPETCQQLLLEKDEAFESAIESLVSASAEGTVTVALVAENSGDGASTAALCIARQAAQLGRNALLVDADVSAPKLATLVGLNTPCSWHDSVVGDVPLAESLVVSIEDRLCLMPLHADCQQSSLSLSDPRVAALLDEASQAYDLVILDCGSIDRLSKRIESDGHLPCDTAVIVRNASREQEQDSVEAPSTLRSLGAGNILFVENFVHEPKPVDEKLQTSAA